MAIYFSQSFLLNLNPTNWRQDMYLYFLDFQYVFNLYFLDFQYVSSKSNLSST